MSKADLIRISNDIDHLEAVINRNAAKKSFDWRSFAKDLAFDLRGLSKMHLRKVLVEKMASTIVIDTTWGRDYDSKPGWDDDLVYKTIFNTAKKHGLNGKLGNDRYTALDGTVVEIGIMADSSGGNTTEF